MSECTPEQLRFPPVEGLTVRADFQGGALSSDFGVMLLRGIDQHIGLSPRLAQAFDDRRHPSYIDHPLAALFAQRTYQIACGYADGNDANSLRGDPLFKLGLDRKPLDAETDLASASTFSRLENAATTRDIYRLAQVFVENYIKLLKSDLASDRTSDHRFLANHLHLFFSYAACVLEAIRKGRRITQTHHRLYQVSGYNTG